MRLGVVTEPLCGRPLNEVLAWLKRAAPEVTDLELVAGGYGPTDHCDRQGLLGDARRREAWLAEIREHGFRIAALNASGNPLHPYRTIAARHDAELRETIRLAALLGVDRVVAMAGLPEAGERGGEIPHFAAGGWLPYLEGVFEWQWERRVAPYWTELCEFARQEHPRLLICLELHPGTCVYNVETFERAAALGANIAANLDPSHFFWQGMDALAVVQAIGPRIGHAHAKDVAFNREALALNGLLDHRWPREPAALPWRFAAAGRVHDGEWWAELVAALGPTPARSLSIEHEDPLEPVEEGIAHSSSVLGPLIAGRRDGGT